MPLINWRANQPCRTGQIYQPMHKNPSSPPCHSNGKTLGILLIQPKKPARIPSLVNRSFPGKIPTQNNSFLGLRLLGRPGYVEWLGLTCAEGVWWDLEASWKVCSRRDVVHSMFSHPSSHLT